MYSINFVHILRKLHEVKSPIWIQFV